MIIDITGISLMPGNLGQDCLGDGTHMDKNGKIIPCCCDACDYVQCCLYMHGNDLCAACTDTDCPRSTGKIKFCLSSYKAPSQLPENGLPRRC